MYARLFRGSITKWITVCKCVAWFVSWKHSHSYILRATIDDTWQMSLSEQQEKQGNRKLITPQRYNYMLLVRKSNYRGALINNNRGFLKSFLVLKRIPKESTSSVNEIHNRRRRQAATDPLDIPIDSRSPNCMDLLLDCGRRVKSFH